MAEPADIVVALARAYSIGELLSPDDGRLRREAERTVSLLEGPVEMEVVGGGLRVAGDGVPDPGGTVTELARDLERVGVERLRLSADVTADGLLSFLSELRDRTGGPGRDALPSEAFAESGISVARRTGDARTRDGGTGLSELFGKADPGKESLGEGRENADRREESRENEPAERDLRGLVDRFLTAAPEERPARAEELRSVADRLRGAGDLDALARAVETLGGAARGESARSLPEAGELARELLDDAVGARVAVRLAALTDDATREERLEAVGSLGPEMARTLAGLLAETDERGARRIWMDALVAVGDDARPEARALLDDPRWFVVRNGVRVLGRIGARDDVPALRGVLTHDDARVRREASTALGRIGGDEAATLLVAALDDPEPTVRSAAATAVGALRLEEAARRLRERLEVEEVDSVRVRILRALGALEDPGAVPLLEEHATGGFFSRPPSEIRIAAYRALARIGTPRARSLVDDARDDRDPAVRRAVRALSADRDR